MRKGKIGLHLVEARENILCLVTFCKCQWTVSDLLFPPLVCCNIVSTTFIIMHGILKVGINSNSYLLKIKSFWVWRIYNRIIMCKTEFTYCLCLKCCKWRSFYKHWYIFNTERKFNQGRIILLRTLLVRSPLKPVWRGKIFSKIIVYKRKRLIRVIEMFFCKRWRLIAIT